MIVASSALSPASASLTSQLTSASTQNDLRTVSRSSKCLANSLWGAERSDFLYYSLVLFINNKAYIDLICTRGYFFDFFQEQMLEKWSSLEFDH